MRTFIYGIGVGIALAFAVVFALNTFPAKGVESAGTTIIVGQ